MDSSRQALHLQPDLADAQNNLGLALAARGLPDEALSCYERAVQLEPGHTGALANLGNAYKDQGRLAEALVPGGDWRPLPVRCEAASMSVTGTVLPRNARA